MNLRKLLFGKKFLVYLMYRSQGTLNFIEMKQIKSDTETIKYKKRTFTIDIERPTFTKGNKNYYLIDINDGQQVFMGKNNETNSEMFKAMNSIVNEKIIDQLTTNLVEKPSIFDKIMYIFMGVGIGLFIGYLVAQILLGGF